MNLIVGVSLNCLAALLFGGLLIGYRNPRPPFWVGGFVRTSLYAIAVLTLPLIGLGILLSFFQSLGQEAAPWAAELIVSVAVIGASAFALKRIRRVVKGYSTATIPTDQPAPADRVAVLSAGVS